MIQAGQMMLRTKEAYEASKLAYDASSALQANVRVSGIVSSFPIEFLSVLILHPLGCFSSPVDQVFSGPVGAR
jgi:hypothetical protein